MNICYRLLFLLKLKKSNKQHYSSNKNHIVQKWLFFHLNLVNCKSEAHIMWGKVIIINIIGIVVVKVNIHSRNVCKINNLIQNLHISSIFQISLLKIILSVQSYWIFKNILITILPIYVKYVTIRI
jgi:hypothetical protein